MTLTHELGRGILQLYLHTKDEVSRSRLSKVTARTGQTHRQAGAMESIYHAAFAGGTNLDIF